MLCANALRAEDITAVNSQAAAIRTVLFPKSDTKQRIPVATLGSGETLTLSFDEIGADGTRTLYYSFVHCDAHFLPSDLMPIDYVDGFNKIYGAETASYSLNTTVDYVHYDVEIDLSTILISGNYLVQIFCEDDGQLMVQRPFMVSEGSFGVDSRLTRSDGTQSLDFSVKTGTTKILDSQREITVMVVQNTRLDDVRYSNEPSNIRPSEIVYQMNSAFTFRAGNEYRWIDNRDYRYPRMNTQSFEFFDPFYHQTLGMDSRPRGYSYHEEFNGGRYIECQYPSNADDDIQADYTLTHFHLQARDYLGEVYIMGALVDNAFSSNNRMSFDPTTNSYTAQLWLKQGLHNYQYLTRSCAECAGDPTEFENSFSDTENDYAICVYWRELSGNYDRLVCVKQHNSKSTLNSFIY